MFSIKFYDTEDLYRLLHIMNITAQDMHKLVMNEHMCHQNNEYCKDCPDKEFCSDTDDLIEWSVNYLNEFK